MSIQISNHALNEKLKQLVCNERQLLTEILEHLREVERRRLYAQRSYSSLFEYCVKELGYSESAAGRRISAMRLIKECPEAKEKLEIGSLNLSTINLASQAFRQAKKDKRPLSLCEKNRVLKNIESKSKKEVEKELLPITNYKVLSLTTQERVVSETHTELKLYLTNSQMKKLNRLNELKGINKSTPELLEWMMDQLLKKTDPLMQASSPTREIKSNTQEKALTAKPQLIPPENTSQDHIQSNSRKQKSLPQRECKKVHSLKKPLTPSRYISVKMKTNVWHKANGCCEYRDPISKRRCTNRSGLEIDHIQPMAKGGKTENSNLRLLCRAHNQMMAQQYFGKSYIEGFYNCTF